jgi:hypothetical protein
MVCMSVAENIKSSRRQATTGFYDGNKHSYITRAADYKHSGRAIAISS